MPEGVSEQETESQRIERWRRKELRRAGYDHETARTLAMCVDVDLREAVELIRAGCEPAVAARILL
jgi:ribosomal protein L13E